MVINIRRVALFMVFVITTLSLIWVVKTFFYGSRAAAGPPKLGIFVADNQEIAANRPFTLVLAVNPNSSPFYSFAFQVRFESTKVELADITDIPSNVSVVDSKVILTETKIDDTGQMILVRGIRTESPFIGASDIPVVKLNMKGKGALTYPVQFTWESETVIGQQPSIVKENLSYAPPTPTTPPENPTPISSGNLTPTITPSTYNGGNNPTPQPQGSTSTGRGLYINSMAAYQAPLRYEQSIVLEKGTYTLYFGARVALQKGRGLLAAVVCGENTCWQGRTINQVVGATAALPPSTGFIEQKVTITIPEAGHNKKYIVRIFCEDGTEGEIDHVILDDNWGVQKLKNTEFLSVMQYGDPRRQPTDWEVDATAQMYGTVDLSQGENGALVINNSVQ